MALTKVINDLADLNQSGSTNALKGCAGTTAQQPASSSSIDYLIVGGGGGNGTLTGGAGAGGLLTGTTTVYHGTPTVITVGEGGPAGPASYPDPLWARNGDDSGFNGIRAIGGGSGGSHGVSNNGIDGGSGGGATSSNSLYSGGSGTTGQGMGGGANSTSSGYGAGGGGGAGNPAGNANGTGGNGTSALGGTGGCGTNMNSFISSTNANLAQVGDVSGSDVFFAGGGGGGIQEANTGGTPFGSPTYPEYANGGGGHGAGDGNASQAGLRNTGGGAGGPGFKTVSSGVYTWGAGADGGSGVAVLKYDNTIVTGYSLNSEDTYTVNWPADKYGVAYWPLNLDVKDVGGNYDGTATNITYTNGQFNQAASFNGSSSIIQRTQPAQPESFTISAWVKTTASGAWNIAVGMGATASYVYGLSMWISGTSNSLYGQWGNGSNPEDYWSTLPTTPINTGDWFHIAVTVNNIASPTVKGYINGVLEGSGYNSGAAIAFDPNLFTIGGRKNTLGALGYYWNGEIEQVRFYATDLSITDIEDIYNNSKPGSLPPLKTSSDLTTTTCNYPSGTTGTALYQFEGDATDTCTTPVAYDLTEVGSPSYVTGKFGTAIQFNGTSQGVTSTSAVIPNPAATISLWYNGNGTATAEFYIIGAGVGGTSYGLDIHYYNGNFWAGVVDGGSFQGVGTGYTPVSTSEWYHLALTWDGSTSTDSMKFYINGVLETNITPTVTAASLTYSSFGIGKTSTSTYAPGIVDQVRIYGSVLTPQQIYDLWQKENSIQTYFSNQTSGIVNTIPANTDILVFKEGSGEITFKNDSPPGAEVGMLRYNSTLGQMEHFNSGGWKDFTKCTTSICNYPTTIAAFYQFNNSPYPTCAGPNPTTTANLTYTNGPYGGAINFNGTDSVWQSTSQIINSQSSFTISMWIRMDAYNGNSQYLWTSYATGDWGISFTNKAPLDRYVSFHKWNSAHGGGLAIDAPDITELDQWYHVCGTFSTTTGMVLYINGVSVATSSTTWTGYNHGAYSDSIGCYGGTWTGPRANFTGQISLFRAFQSTLTATQVTELYNEVHCP